MKTRILGLISGLALLSVIVACGGSQQQTEEGLADAAVSAVTDIVTVLQANVENALDAGDSLALAVGDGVTVDQSGRAVLSFANEQLIVEALRDGSLTLEEFDLLDTGLSATLNQTAGTTLNNLNADVEARISVETNFAIITATGTEFMVSYEEGTPLEWVIAREASDNDLMITSLEDGTTRTLEAGQAMWIAEYGPPSRPIDANMPEVEEWLNGVREGLPVEDVGEVVMPEASKTVSPEDVRGPLSQGDTLQMGDVTVTMNDGRFTITDCNWDGKADIRMVNGSLLFDLRDVPLRIRELHATIINDGDRGSAVFSGFNPAFEPTANPIEPISVAYGTAPPGEQETLTLVSAEQPYYFAELRLADGCFIELGLDHPEQDDYKKPTPVAYNTIVPTAEILPTFTPSVAPSAEPTICAPQQPPGWAAATVQPGDTYAGYASRSGVSEATIRQVNCAFGSLNAGDVLWLPPNAIVTPITPTAPPQPILITQLTPANQARIVCDGQTTARSPDYAQVDFAWQPSSVPPSLIGYEFELNGQTLGRESVVERHRTAANQTALRLLLPCSLTEASWRVRALAQDEFGQHPWSDPASTLTVQQVPRIAIRAVSPARSVTISPSSFPPNQTFIVSMGAAGTGGVNGYSVETVTTDANGTLSNTTFAIPRPLAFAYDLDVRLQSSAETPTAATATFLNVPRTPGKFSVQSTDEAMIFSWVDLSANEEQFCVRSVFDGLYSEPATFCTTANQTNISLPRPENGSYQYEVVACTQGVCSRPSPTLAVTILPPPLPAPVLISPDTDALIGCTSGPEIDFVTVQFVWEAVEGAQTYLFNGESTDGATSREMRYPCSAETYTWQVVADAEGRDALPSEVRTFTIVPPTPLPAPVLISPADGAKIECETGFETTTIDVRVVWEAVEGAETYLLNGESTGDATSQDGSLPCTAATYTWQVVASAAGRGAIPSEVRSFTIVPRSPEPDIVFGADGTLLYWRTNGVEKAYLVQQGTSEFYDAGNPTEGSLDVGDADSAYPVWEFHAVLPDGSEIVRETTVIYSNTP